MSNARELALLEKWTSSSDGATILPALSSPTSPKATKFCCCPNRRRYTLKQPKLTTTLHVRNIFVDNDFNFIDDTTTENDDDDDNNEEGVEPEESGYEEILIYDNKNYKRAESWPSARKTLKNRNRINNSSSSNNKNNNNNTKNVNNQLKKPIEIPAGELKENLGKSEKVTFEDNDYDDIIEVATRSSSISTGESQEKLKAIETEEEWQRRRRHDKSCHNNRNNCLTKSNDDDHKVDNKQYERKSRNIDNDDTNDIDIKNRCSIESSIAHKEKDKGKNHWKHPERSRQQQQQQQQLSNSVCGLRKSLSPPKVNDASSIEGIEDSGKDHSENIGEESSFSNLKLNKANEQIAPTTITSSNSSTLTTKTKAATSPLIQRLSELSEFKDSLCKQEFSNTPATATATTPTTTHKKYQQQKGGHCNNCQEFCFNQSCRNFSQLQQSLQDTKRNENVTGISTSNTINKSNNQQQQQQPQLSSTVFGGGVDTQKMTITTATNVANNFQSNEIVATSPTTATTTARDLHLTSDISNTNTNRNCGLSMTTTATATSMSLPTSRTLVPPTTLSLTSSNRPTSPISPTAHWNTPSSPLTTTVIKTTMVKRSPANESSATLATTTTTTPTSPTSASLTLEKSLAFITAAATSHQPVSTMPNNVHHEAKENKPVNQHHHSSNNKCLTDVKSPSPLQSSPMTATPMSVKERIAALVAGNEQNQKQHDNFINRTSMKTQCNKPMRSTTATTLSSQQQQSNMTYPLRQQHNHQQQRNEPATISSSSSQSAMVNNSGNSNSSSNMCQKSPSPTTLRLRKLSFATDEVDSAVATTSGHETNLTRKISTNLNHHDEEDINDSINHKGTTATVPSASSSSSSSGLVSTTSSSGRFSKPASSLSVDTNKIASSSSQRYSPITSNHNPYHNADVNKYGSNSDGAASSATSASSSSTKPTMTVDMGTQQHSPILNNTTNLFATSNDAAVVASSSSNDTNGDNSRYDLTADATAPVSNPSSQGGKETAEPSTSSVSNCRSKLEALANLDLAFNLSDLPLDVDDDDDPYFVLQEYLERVKHEINEVFELHKARQKAQQLQQQQQQQQQQDQEEHAVTPSESDTNRTASTTTTTTPAMATIENQIIDTLKAAVSNDELSRSTESDSGFDSATGGGWRLSRQTTIAEAEGALLVSGSNKLPSRAKVTTTSTNAMGNDNNTGRQVNSDSDTRVMEHSTGTNGEGQQGKELIPTNGSSGEDGRIMVPNREHQGKQELGVDSKTSASVTTSSPSSLSVASTTEGYSSTLKRLRKQLQSKSPAEVATDDVNMWANKFLRDLDNLMASDKVTTTTTTTMTSSSASSLAARNSISPGPTSPMLLSAAATAVIQSRYGKGAHDRYAVGQGSASYDHHHHQLSSGSTGGNTTTSNGIVLRPEKHATIPLQSFNLDCGRLDSNSNGSGSTGSGGNGTTKTNVTYLRTLSAPTPSQTIYQALLHNNHDSGNGGKLPKHHQLAQRNSLAGGAGGYSLDHHHHQNSNLTNFIQSNDAAGSAAMDMSHGDIKSTMSSAAKLNPTTILKIEETTSSKASNATLGTVGAGTVSNASPSATESPLGAIQPVSDVESLHQKRLRQLNMEMDNLRNTSIDQSQQLSALMQQNHYCTGGSGGGQGTGSNGGGGGGNKHKTLMTTSSCAMPKKATSSNGSGTTAATSSSQGSPAQTMTCNRQQQQSQQQTQSQSVAATSYLLHGSDATKKGSTSTIWTSEESILRSVGAVDEDNNSTSSSACEEASGALSSGKSGISLDSSGVENDNNESGIGTATPPKDMSYWKSMPHHHRHHHHHHNQQDNESISSLEAMLKIKFQKGSSVTSSDDPDLLEVLSLCDDTHNDEKSQDDELNHNSSLKSTNNEEDMDDDYDMVDVEDEGHDDFEIATYCDCDCVEDGDASSASAGSSGPNRPNNSINNGSLSDSNGSGGGVVLRRKYAASPIMVPQQKCRSHSLDTSSLPNSYHHHQQQQHHHQQGHGSVHHHHHQHIHVGQHAQLARKLQHLRDRQKDRNQLSLALRQEPFQSLLAPTHFHELPSPSSASLHSGHEILDTQELSTKSNSAPLLLKQEKRLDDFANQNVTLRYSRSQSDRYLAEIEAVEACKWLRAAGFPQYAQMYEDHQFPIDLSNVAKDHTNLEDDQLQSLFRRLCILNRCANMRVDQSHKAQTPQKEDSDDENFALSENWTFQPHIRRWSRIGEMGLEIPPAAKLTACEKTESSSKESSPDRFEDDAYDVLGAPLSLTLPGSHTDDSADPALNDSTDLNASPLRRTGSERLKDGAKAILRRVESIKSRRRKRQGIVLSGPQALDLSQLGQRSSLRKPDAVYSTPPSPSAVSPMHSFNKGPLFGNELKVPSQSDNFLSPNRSSPKRTPTTPRSMRTSPLHFFTNTMPYVREGKSDDSSSYYSDSQESSSAVNKLSIRKTPSKARRFLQRTGKVDDIGAHSDSECHQGRKLLIKDANSNTTEVKTKKLSRGGSLNLGRDGKKRDGFRSASFRSRSTTRKEVKPEETETIKKSAPVVRWHSFQMEERPTNMIFRKCFAQKNDPHSNEHGILFAAMSAGQLQMIRKLALVTLTGYMERYCPTHRSGWNWELPKFIKKIKMPDYKDKRVFGVPLLLILQRSGQTLPIAVRAAFRWLQLNALDQIGLFRKSGVKSRILKLKELIEYSETSAECMDVFDTQQAYDVADMLKQYFRDLPESLLTTKMSETFAAIFQHLPPDVRLDAIQSAVLLLPDENREILYALLEFLTLVAANSQYNQMTANNLAVCLAPSLFHSSISTGSNSVTASPRRKGKGSGVPDAKELFEAKASHECLAFMIQHYKQIYTAPKEKLSKCKFSYMEESKPLPLEALGEGMQFHNWRGYLYESTSATIKEGREKSRGWITTTSLTDPNVEIAYKKVGDGHPLRLWRCITEIEGPPKDVLDYIIRQRASWDPNLLQSQTIKKFDECTEIFQYAIDGQQCTDFCVLRSWRTDLPRGACVIVETSIDHAKAKPMFNAIRGVVLASRYLIEPCGSGRSRVMHLARVDVKGKTPEWYNKSYGHISSHFLTRIRLAFKNVADGPESKV